MPFCTKCKLEKETTEFSKRKSTKTGLGYTCKACCAISHYKWYHKNPHINRERSRKATWKSMGLDVSIEDYNNLCNQQENKCAICGKVTKLYLDHCHDTLQIRGVLCSFCNTGLGYFKDNPELLTNAIEYIDRAKRRLLRRTLAGA